MFPFVKILSSRSTAELTLDVNQYLNQLEAQNNQNDTQYAVKNLTFKVTALPDCGVMYSVMIVVTDGSDYNASAFDPSMLPPDYTVNHFVQQAKERCAGIRPEDIPF